ncbi:hypothetical protein [Porphyromonas uenonis]|uniref:hypothetical protein n=1 Tax=Porphyromonas uenonis TaxID=281920 RepID=UPI0005C4DFDE|nr:hypothetical protein [Porphyromonas uenonis]
MKRYRYITLSLLLLLLSISALSAQKDYQRTDKETNYLFKIKTTPSYCQNDGTIMVTLADPGWGLPIPIAQIEKVEYDVRAQDVSYSKVYVPASAPTDACLIEQLPGRKDYRIYVRITPKEGVGKSVHYTEIPIDIEVENKYVDLAVVKEEFDPYRLTCRPYGRFHIVARGSAERPPHLNIEDAPKTFTGARKMQPTKQEVKDGFVLYHFDYNGVLPQGTYKYTVESKCRRNDQEKFDVYGPDQDLPEVPTNLKIPFGINIMSGEGCASDISEFGANFSKDKPELRELFKEINKGHDNNPEAYFPEYRDSFPSTFMANYEVVVVSQQEYEKIQQGTLDASTLLWSSQTGSLTKVYANDSEGGGVSLSYRLPQSMSLRELGTKKALPGAVLIRVKRPNTGCTDYITIPIAVDLNFHKRRFELLKTESTLDCSIGQIVWFQGWNFCSLYIKYYELADGESKPAPGTKPVHTSDDFGPAVSTLVDKRYTFEGYDPTKRYYVELDVIDLYGKPVTPKPSLILAPTNGKPVKNRLFDFGNLYVRLDNPLSDKINRPLDAYLAPAYGTKLFTTQRTSLNALAGMKVTLVRAPEGYEEFQKSREDYYYRKPDPTKTDTERFGGGMIRLGETIELSSTFTETDEREELYPFRFLYIEGKDGQRVVYPYNKENGTDNLKSVLVKDDAKLKYMSEHLMPRGIYRFKFEHPCQPGASFYINIDMNEPNFEPKLTELIDPVVDYVSCDEAYVYPFADGRLDYGIDENGRPRNLVFYVTGLPGGDSKYLYFFPFDSKGNPIDHTKFYIPLKIRDLDPAKPKINLRYFYPQSTYQWIIYDKGSNWVDSVGVDQFVLNELQGGGDSRFKLPISDYKPADDIDDWGDDGMGWRWREWPYLPWVSVDVPINVTKVIPSYSRPTYVGYRCSKETGYMEFKLINIPNKTGTVVLKDGETVIKSEDISKLTDLMVRWDLAGNLKNEYTLEITTSPCPGGQGMPTEKFTVKLIDITEGIEVTFSPRRGLCPGETVTLTASNLGIDNKNYTWKITKADGSIVSRTGRIVSCDVVAPRVASDGKAHYNTYELTVTGTKCGGEQFAEGIIPVAPDELWWKPDLDGYGTGTLPGAPGEDETPNKPESSDAKYYDWHNPDNWVFLHERKFYPAKAVPTRCTNVHIMNLSEFDIPTKQGTFRAQPDLAKEVTLRDLYGEPTCIDITFHSGAFVYNIQQLNYRRAMVRYNFGVANATGGYDRDKYIYTDKEHDTDEWPYERNELNLLAAPLYDIYAGDYSFSASPYTYQLGFKAVPGVDKNDQYNVATFDPSAFNDPSPLQSISMAGNNNCIALVVAKDTQGFNRKSSTVPVITQRRGILELPYFDRPDIASSFYHQTYDASTGQTRFQYFDGKAKRFRGYYSYAQRSKMAYRFIFEDPATQRIPKLAGDTEGYTMEVSATAAGQEVMVGNPFMAPLEVVPFLEANKDVIEPYVRLLYPKVTSYDPLKLEGSITTYYRDEAGSMKIDQLGAFVVKLKSGVGPKAQLVFPTSALDSYAKQHPQSRSLRSTSGDATAETARYLSLTLQSRLGKDRALVAYGYESGSVDKMLLSTESRYPSIAIIDPAGGSYKDLYADDAATDHYGLATRVSEPIDVTLSLAGSVMGHVVTARLIDHKSGLEHDLTGGKSCQIKLFPDDAEGRLELRVDGDFTSVAPMAEPTDELQAQYSEGMLTVRTTQEMSSLRLVQGDGITVYTQSLPGLTEYSERILLSSGSYVVEAVGTDGVARRAMLVVR